MTPGPRDRRAADAAVRMLGKAKRALYQGGHPARVARWWNRLDAWVYSTGLLLPRHAAVLKVRGRRTGRTVAVPVALADVDDAEFLVSMLGPDANWVRNVEVAGGVASLRRRRRDIPVLLELVPPQDRAPILRRYVAIAPGARPHLGLGPDAPLEEFAHIAGNHPVYRIHQRPTAAADHG